MKIHKKIFVVLAVAMLMFSMVLATSYGVNVPANDKKDTGITIESQSKTVSYKITWNGNGGKIGSKKTTITNVKKGSKIGKLATTPKRNGFTFKGWYTKKTGGTKITKNTKPTKSVTYHAQWKKTLNPDEAKLVGEWHSEYDASAVYTFNANGSFNVTWNLYGSKTIDVGYFSVKNGVITKTYQSGKKSGDGWKDWSEWKTSTGTLKFKTENGKQYMTMTDILWYVKV